jgi:hypothetical protein
MGQYDRGQGGDIYLLERLLSWGATLAQEMSGREENVTFSLPAALRP